ncbi:amidohydrolase family protein [Burkholderia stagnalis]
MSAAPWSSGEAAANTALPVGSVDCHHHVYDNRFPYDPDTKMRLPDATVAHYRQLQRRLGLQRNVIVQPSSYGTDNRCLVDALHEFGSSARGVAVIDDSISDHELQFLDEAGVRGVRFNFSRPAGAGMELLGRIAARIAPFGWHIQVHTLGAGYVALESHLRALPVPLVIDHLGRVPQPEGVQHESFAVLRRLMDRGDTWIKLSGAYHDSLAGAPHYADTGVMVRTWLDDAPERVVWGTDWPHPAAIVGEKPMPDDARLLDLFGEWAGDGALLKKVMVGNPCRLYGFAEPDSTEN